MASRGVADYQLHVVGFDGVPEGAAPGAYVVVRPEEPGSVEGWLSALAGSGLSGADLRTHLLVHPDPSDPVAAVLFVTAVAGFAGRMPDLAVDGVVLNSSSVYRAVAAFKDEGKPEVPERAVVSGQVAVEGGVPADFSRPLPPELVSVLRYAHHGVLALDGRSAAEVLTALVVLSALREVRRKPRFPWFLREDFSMEQVGEGVRPVPPEGSYDLEGFRRAASAVRREVRLDVRDTVVAEVPVPARSSRLSAAASVGMEAVLVALGSEQSGEAWRCPRPERHTNGDRNPSAQVDGGRFMCHRCEVEPVDALRLVMDVRGVSPDEAAAWLEEVPA